MTIFWKPEQLLVRQHKATWQPERAEMTASGLYAGSHTKS